MSSDNKTQAKCIRKEMSFVDAATARGLIFSQPSIADGMVHRVPVEGKPNRKDGAYCLRPDGSGWFQNYRDGLGVEYFPPKTGSKLTRKEKALRQKQVDKAQKQYAKEKKARQAKASKEARKQWKEARPATADHPYLTRKGIKPYAIREWKGDLLIPLRRGKKIYSVQRITPDGEKRFREGGRKKGCYCAIDSVDEMDVVGIAEGYATAVSVHEATGYPIAVAFDAGNMKPVGEYIRKQSPQAKIVFCADDDYQSSGNPGVSNAKKAARAVNGIVAIPEFGDKRPDGATDFNDLHLYKGLKAVKRCIKAALEKAPEKKEAKRENQTVEMLFPKIKPWKKPIQLGKLLSRIVKTIKQHIACEDEIANATALWIAMTWITPHISIAPLLVISSPEKGSGKTTLLSVLRMTACKPLPTSNITSAALARTIDAHEPTLLIDEYDSFVRGDEGLRGILNAGHSRQMAFTIRLTGDDHEPTLFNVFGPKALAGIGTLPDTIMDRSIVLKMRRKLESEVVERLRHDAHDDSSFLIIRRKLAKFAVDFGEVIGKARPVIPTALSNRAGDNVEPLLAIADAAGGKWPERARTSILKLSRSDGTTQSRGVELLADIRDVFEEILDDRIFTCRLLELLCDDEEKPWSTYNRGKPITARQFSSRLFEYGIRSRSLRLSGKNKKGYLKTQFQDAFTRYLTPALPEEG